MNIQLEHFPVGKTKILPSKLSPTFQFPSRILEKLSQDYSPSRNIQIINSPVGKNISWITTPNPTLQTNPTKVQDTTFHYLIPQHKMHLLSQDMEDTFRQKKQKSCIKAKKTFKSLSIQKQSYSQLHVTENISEFLEAFQSTQEYPIRVLDFQPTQDLQSPSYLPQMPSYLNKKGTIFGSAERSAEKIVSIAPAPNAYKIHRFADDDDIIIKLEVPARQKQKSEKRDALQLLKKRSISLLPNIKGKTKDSLENCDKVKRQKIYEKPAPIISDPLVDRFGQFYHPIKPKIINPGPTQYGDSNINSIEKRMGKINEESKMKKDIKEWLKKQMR